MNYNDNEVFCGGYGVQWSSNGGKCGVCGDNYQDEVPRAHETGGKFGNEIIGATYTTGAIIDIDIEIVANHWGYFELKLCPVDASGDIVTQDCLDEHPYPYPIPLPRTAWMNTPTHTLYPYPGLPG